MGKTRKALRAGRVQAAPAGLHLWQGAPAHGPAPAPALPLSRSRRLSQTSHKENGEELKKQERSLLLQNRKGNHCLKDSQSVF